FPSAFVALCFATAAFASNPIQIENAKAGSPDWQLESVASHEIEGYASATSINRGASLNIFVNTTDSTYTINVYRLGWYGGVGGRQVLGPFTGTGHQQVIPAPDPTTGMIECNWVDPYTIATGADWTSGVYVVKLTADHILAAGGQHRERYVLFVVRDDASQSNHYLQINTNTSEAYNAWGGKSLYAFNSTGGAADLVSYNRPYDSGSGTGDFLYGWEYNMVRFLEREGYDVTYCTNVDADLRGSLIGNHKSLLIVGHDEYWSWNMRQSVQGAIDNGVSAAFFASNGCYWQIRYQASAITRDADRTIVGYKEDALTKDPYATDGDSTNDKYVTVQWRQPPVNLPEAALIGVQYVADPVNGDIVIDDVTSAPWIFAGTTLTTGSVLHGLLGYEVDKIESATPAGTIRLAHSWFTTTKPTGPQITDYADMSIYTAASGATVFGAGTMQWSWGVDDWIGRTALVDPRVQQMTRNLLRHFAGASAPNDCQTTISPAAMSIAQAAAGYTFSLTTASTCAWKVSAQDAWITITSPQSGGGDATVTFNVAANVGAARTGTIVVGDKTFVVSQASGCTYSYSPSTAAYTAASGSGTITVASTQSDCPWSAAATDSWITITSGASGTGGGTIAYTVAANSGTSRNGAIVVNGTRITISQPNGCMYVTEPANAAFPTSGGTGRVTVSTDSTCYWTTSTGTPWIVINSPSQSSGSGSVDYQVQPNTMAGARTGEIGVAGNSVIVSQNGSDCAIAVSPQNAMFTAAAGSGTLTISAAADCAWSVATQGAFLSIASGWSGAGNGTVAYSVAQNATAYARSGWIIVNTVPVAITQQAAGVSWITLDAQATSTTTATLTWTAVAGATGYEVLRSTGPSGFSVIGKAGGTSFGDSRLQPSSAYLYEVRAVNAFGPIAYSNIDVATTLMFTDPVLQSGVTPVKAVHWTELRTAIDAVRAAARLAPAAYSDSIQPGLVIRLRPLVEMRSALDQARAAIGLPPIAYADGAVGAIVIKAAHVRELRAGVQ
ncbi:MAG TPA: N,N-dimethylformamidase beta subunit family domain-containing protein, partial [Thermoanaerobaculia bacterium]|nr:N,N-dimethylformamidase beta subunit family domain-containing protein [Thermoanaerobaculia bacterium]